MNEQDRSFQNLIIAMKELGIEGDPYEIADEYGIFDDERKLSHENYEVTYTKVPYIRSMSVDEMKKILKDYKKR